MRKQVYISADYSETDGDKDVVDELNKWGNDDYHRVDFVDMSQVASGSVSKEPDCRICDLKAEFNSHFCCRKHDTLQDCWTVLWQSG